MRVPTPQVEGREAQATLDAQEHAANVLRFRGALVFGFASWLAFFPLDLFVVRFIEPGPITWYAAVRGFGAAIIGALWIATRTSPLPGPRALHLFEQAGYTIFTALCALLALPFRGMMSPYFAGAMIVLFTRGATTAERWRDALRHGVAPLLAFPLTLVVACALDPAHRAQLHDRDALASFGLSMAFVIDAYVLAAVLGHVVWALRQQVFEARSLGRYRLKRRIGSGGMGDVWVAHHATLKRDVAVKILRPDKLGHNASAASRFEREVRATTELLHPNTVRIFDYGVTDDGLHFYAMELLEGEHLGALVAREGPLPPPRAIHIASQAARALAEAHGKGIVHRDVKPENVLVTSPAGEQDVVKVLDFGIAKMRETDADAKLTGTGSMIGTPAYLSPEAVNGLPLDARADVYQLGAVLYLLLTGSPPFDASTLGALLSAHLDQPPVAPSVRRGQALPADLEAVVLRCLEKDPSARYASCAELADALAACADADGWRPHARLLDSRVTSGDASPMAETLIDDSRSPGRDGP